MTHQPGETRLHLALARPWRAALDALRGDSSTDEDLIEWKYPDAEPGDTYIQFLDSPIPAVAEIGLIIDDPHYDRIDFESTDSFHSGISIRAIERRIGRSLPDLPATIVDPDLAEKIHAAIEAETIRSTPWREIGGDCCQPHLRPAVNSSAYGCPCCHRTDILLEFHSDMNHIGDDSDSFGTMYVCRDCHDTLHRPLPPRAADLVFGNNPACPSCSSRKSSVVITGMPPGPPPPGYHAAGCLVTYPLDDFNCGSCGLSWSEQDVNFPRASVPGPGVRVRARVQATSASAADTASFLYQPGRLVLGSPVDGSTPPGFASAWDAGGCVELIGDDGRDYLVDLASIRHLDPIPTPEGVQPMSSHRVITEAGDDLFPRLVTAAGDVTLCAPFLTFKVASRLAELAKSSQVEWYLLTHLDAHAAANGYLSVNGLRAMLEAGVNITSYPGLHAKAYVIGTDYAMLGSANLTDAGLGERSANAEMSFVVPEADVAAVQGVLDEWWEAGEDVDEEKLDQLETLAGRIARWNPPVSPTPSSVEELLSDAQCPDVTLWIKAHYGPARPEGWNREAWFSTSGSAGTPSFGPGDLVAVYSQEDHCCYGIVEVLDEPTYNPDFVADNEGDENGERWPWVNTTTPRLVPTPQVGISLRQLGLNPQGLQNGRRKLAFNDFKAIVDYLDVGAR